MPVYIGSPDRDFQSVTTEGEGTKCSDDIRDYYEIHKDVIEDLDGYVKKHGLVRGLI